MPRPYVRRNPTAATIICRTCQVEKPVDQFRPKRSECFDCEKARMINRRAHIREQRAAGALHDVNIHQPTLCKTCGEMKPLGEFRKNRNSLTGYMQPCAQCTVKQVTDYHQRIKKKRAAGALPEVDTAQPWVCTHCGETKPMHEFMTQQHTRTGYAQPCKECCAEKSREYAKNHPEKAKEWRDKNPEKVIKSAQKWQQANPDKVRGHWATRRARKRNARIEKVEYAVLYERDRGICQLQYSHCKGRITKQQGTIDHIIPLALGGEHSYRNIQLACRSCNFKKGHRGKGDQMRLF